MLKSTVFQFIYILVFLLFTLNHQQMPLPQASHTHRHVFSDILGLTVFSACAPTETPLIAAYNCFLLGVF
jgi:hypothetical protein